jgi:hypothetical protein
VKSWGFSHLGAIIKGLSGFRGYAAELEEFVYFFWFDHILPVILGSPIEQPL